MSRQPHITMLWRCKCELPNIQRIFRPSSDLWLVVVRELQRYVFKGAKDHMRHGLYDYELIGYDPRKKPLGLSPLQPEDRVVPGVVYVIERRPTSSPVDRSQLQRRRNRKHYDLLTDEERAIQDAEDAADQWAREMGYSHLRNRNSSRTTKTYSDCQLPGERQGPRGVPTSMTGAFAERHRKIKCET